MSIKQNGGVFGRNPTFNDVTIEGQLTFDGDIDINSDLKVDGTIEADKLIMEGSGSLLELYRSGANANFGAIELNDTTNTGTNAKIGWNANTLRLEGTSTIDLVTNNTSALAISSTNVVSFKSTGGTTEMFFNGANLVMANGRGIDFSATAGTGTSELFDDYEEGAFVCTINGAVEPATLITSTGYYTKIGRDVFFQVSFESVDTTGYSGTLSFSGLPFVSASTFGRSITNIIQYSGATYTGSPVGEISSNSSIVNAKTDVSGAPWGVMSHNAGSGRFFLDNWII